MINKVRKKIFEIFCQTTTLNLPKDDLSGKFKSGLWVICLGRTTPTKAYEGLEQFSTGQELPNSSQLIF